MEISDRDILVSYDVSALFTNAPVDETIGILARKAFKDDWFNKEYNLNITETDLIELLEVSTKNQLFQFQGVLYEQRSANKVREQLSDLSRKINTELVHPVFIQATRSKMN